MTREEMRRRRELEKAIGKDFLRPISKKYGYKIIGRIPYCVHNDWLYTIYVSNSHDRIHMVINVKPIAIEEAESALEQAFSDANEKIAGYCEQIKTIRDFKELVQNHEPVNHLNCILCDIVSEDFESALAKTEEELSQKHSGGFVSLRGEDIYKYVQRYCKSRL